MRMRRDLMKTYHLRRKTTEKGPEGTVIPVYAAAVEIKATIWAASGRVQAEMYGERLTYIKNMEYEGPEAMQEGDGICVFVGPDDEPDYKIISIKPERSPKQMEFEKI